MTRRTCLKRWLRRIACLALTVSLVGCSDASSKHDSQTDSQPVSVTVKSIREQAVDEYLALIKSTDYCTHALGEIDGYKYTNSLDALWYSYERGARLFESDIHLTSDGRAVLVHGFEKNDYLKRIGAQYYPDEYEKEDKAYIPTHDEFMTWRIQGRYQPLDFEMLADFIRAHPDTYVLADVWSQDFEGTKAVYTAMCEACGYDEAVLCRIIAGGHTQEMIRAVKEVYDFPILNLYFSDEMIDDTFTQEDFITYCKSQGIQSFSCADSYCTAERLAGFEGSGLISYVFTVDDPERARVLKALGVDIVGSDILR